MSSNNKPLTKLSCDELVVLLKQENINQKILDFLTENDVNGLDFSEPDFIGAVKAEVKLLDIQVSALQQVHSRLCASTSDETAAASSAEPAASSAEPPHQPPASSVRKITTVSELKQLVNPKKLTVVHCAYRSESLAGRKRATVFSQLATQKPNVQFLEFEWDKDEELRNHIDVECLPSYAFYTDGFMIDRRGTDSNRLQELIEKNELFAVNREQFPAKWASLCGCCSDIGATFDACFCFPCFVAASFEPLGDVPRYLGACLVTCLIPPCGGWFTYLARKEVRVRLNIINDSDICDSEICDCPISCWCPVCALVQQKRTLALWGQWHGSEYTEPQLTLVDPRVKIPVAGQMGGAPDQGVQ